MAEPRSARVRRAVGFVVLFAVLVTGLLLLRWSERAESNQKTATVAADAKPEIPLANDGLAGHSTSAAELDNDGTAMEIAANQTAIYDCSDGFDAMLAQYRPSLAAQLKVLDAKQKFIDATGPFTGSFGDPVHLGYPGYESYELTTLATLGDNGDQIANVIYAARQLGDIRQYVSTDTDRRFNDAAFAEHFSRLTRALEAGQVGALHVSQYLLRLRAQWSSEPAKHGVALSNRAAVIELQAWQAAAEQVGTLTERVIAAVFADGVDQGSFRLLSDEEHLAVQKRRDALLASTLKSLTKPVSRIEQETEAVLKELLVLLQDKNIATLRCKDGRSLQQAINETFIDD